MVEVGDTMEKTAADEHARLRQLPEVLQYNIEQGEDEGSSGGHAQSDRRRDGRAP
jgi:hypothetical protein